MVLRALIPDGDVSDIEDDYDSDLEIPTRGNSDDDSEVEYVVESETDEEVVEDSNSSESEHETSKSQKSATPAKKAKKN